MQTIVKDFSRSFVRLKIWQADGSYVETTTLSNKGVLYWARTPSGFPLVGIDRDGLDKILVILGDLEKEERAALELALKDLSEADLEQLEVEVDLTTDTVRYKILYRDPVTDATVFDSFDEADALLRIKRGYSHPG